MRKFGTFLQVGQDINGYTLRKFLGQGTFGQVWEANASISEIVAIKQIIPKPGPGYQRQIHFIKEEIRIMQTVKHPNLVELLEYFVDDDVYYLVMPVYDTDLATYIQDCGGRISEERAIAFLKQLGMGFIELGKHKIIHRDFKMENVLMNSETCTLAISDFGLSTCGTGLAASFVGTPMYTAPEVMRVGFGYNPSLVQYDSKIDLFSLGLCFYRMVMGKYPYKIEKLTRETLFDAIVNHVGCNLDFTSDVPVSEFSKQLMREMTEAVAVRRIDWNDLLERLEQWKPENNSHRDMIPNDLKEVTNIMLLQGFRMKESIIFDLQKMKIHADYTESINQLRNEARNMDRFPETEAAYKRSWELTCKNYNELITFLYEIPQRCKFVHQKQIDASRSLGSHILDCLEDLIFLVMIYLDRLIVSLISACTDRTHVAGFKQQKHDYFLASKTCEKFVKDLNANRKALRQKFNEYQIWIEKVAEETEFVSVPDFEISKYSKINVTSLENFPVFSELMKAIKQCQEHLMEYTIRKILVPGSFEANKLRIIQAKLHILINFETELQLVASPTEQYDFEKQMSSDFLKDSDHYFEKAKKSATK